MRPLLPSLFIGSLKLQEPLPWSPPVLLREMPPGGPGCGEGTQQKQQQGFLGSLETVVTPLRFLEFSSNYLISIKSVLLSYPASAPPFRGTGSLLV